jgi:hypothetical protein
VADAGALAEGKLIAAAVAASRNWRQLIEFFIGFGSSTSSIPSLTAHARLKT